MTVLALRNVSKTYGSGANTVHALREVGFAVELGELVAVMGPSGSGKTTLLTIAGALEEPSDGEVLVDERSVLGMSRKDRAALRRRSIGYVFQDFNLLPGLTALENVALPLELDGTPARRARAQARVHCPIWTSEGPNRVFPTSFPAVSGSGSRWRGRSSANGGCCSPTSRPARSTRPTARRCCG